jgi:predicted transcriptional regulator of viral defense system
VSAAVTELADVARDQAGYVTVAQAKRLGIDGNELVRMARRGDLRRVAHGTYAFPASFHSPREPLIASWLRLTGDRLPWDRQPPGAVVSHQSAAAVHGFGTFPAVPPSFTVDRRRYQPPEDTIRLYNALLEPSDWAWVVVPEGIRLPVTRPARTIVDLAFAGEERSQVLDALAEAREAGLLTDEEVVDAENRRRRRRGRGSASWLTAALKQ